METHKTNIENTGQQTKRGNIKINYQRQYMEHKKENTANTTTDTRRKSHTQIVVESNKSSSEIVTKSHHSGKMITQTHSTNCWDVTGDHWKLPEETRQSMSIMKHRPRKNIVVL